MHLAGKQPVKAPGLIYRVMQPHAHRRTEKHYGAC